AFSGLPNDGLQTSINRGPSAVMKSLQSGSNYADFVCWNIRNPRHPRNPWQALFFLAAALCSAITAEAAQISPSLPAAAAFEQWAVQERILGPRAFTDTQAVASGLALAQAREQEMRALMERDPQEFVRRAMAETERAQLPLEIRSLIEQRIKGRGFFG